MNPVMSFKEYFTSLKGLENEPASMALLLAPFKVDDVPLCEDEFLLMGHVLDAIADGIRPDSLIDAALVLEMALDLGVAA